ncbi:MAG: ABC transporter substrate-binding protein [Saprospiraceae bacterium]|nr:ABC transporter substrate-binding protein [Saprospiraceae bacterium]
MGRETAVSFPPRRIVSIVPSQTELLHDLGLDAEVAGLTKFCVHPAQWRRSKMQVGGTKQLHLDRIDALQPDLIIGNKEENDREQIETLARRYPVWMSDVRSLPDALDMITRIGEITDRAAQAIELSSRIAQAFDELKAFVAGRSVRRAAYFIWRNPWMAAASDTFIHEMMGRAGFLNAFGHLERYPEISPTQLAAANPDVILLSSEPYPFREKHFAAFSACCPTADIRIVDGEMFSWYGSRLLQTAGYLRWV